MTKRKPLQWVPSPWTKSGDMPDCYDCLEWLMAPGIAEAIASVGIETGGVNVHAMVDSYHANRHRETTP